MQERAVMQLTAVHSIVGGTLRGLRFQTPAGDYHAAAQQPAAELGRTVSSPLGPLDRLLVGAL